MYVNQSILDEIKAKAIRAAHRRFDELTAKRLVPPDVPPSLEGFIWSEIVRAWDAGYREGQFQQREMYIPEAL